MFRVFDPVAIQCDPVPKTHERPHLAQLFDEPDPGVAEERDASHHIGHALGLHVHRVEHRDRIRQRKGDLLNRRGSRLLEVVGADVDRIPSRNLIDGELDHVGRQPHRGLGWKDVGPAREVFLDDVVLSRPLKLLSRDSVSFGHRDVEREQPRCRGVDRHRGVHAVERDSFEERVQVFHRRDRDPHLPDLAARERMVGVVARLRR
jgi:hypothetical protein